MSLLNDALRAGHSRLAHAAPDTHRVLVAGGAGSLGAAVLEQLLASRHFSQVAVVVTQPLNTALRGLVTVDLTTLPLRCADHAAEDTAVIVFDRARHANGREQAFLRPQPDRLAALAADLRLRGVRHLMVVMPHAAATLPDALKRGLANLDEQAVAALGFDHLVFVRSAQASLRTASASLLQGLADWVLSQAQLLIPQRDKPVRPIKVAQFVAQIAARLPHSPPGTRVVPPELVWEAAQCRDIGTLADAWLHGRALGESTPGPMRM